MELEERNWVTLKRETRRVLFRDETSLRRDKGKEGDRKSVVDKIEKGNKGEVGTRNWRRRHRPRRTRGVGKVKKKGGPGFFMTR